MHMGFRRAGDGALCCCIRAVTGIPSGSEVTISYLADLVVPTEERRAALAHHVRAAQETHTKRRVVVG